MSSRSTARPGRRSRRPAPAGPRIAIRNPLVDASAAPSDGRREHPEAQHQDPTPAEQIGGPPTQQQEPAERQPVGGDHPLQVRLREVQRVANRRQGDVHDRQIDDRHEERDRQNGECAPTMNRVITSLRPLQSATNSPFTSTDPGGRANSSRRARGDAESGITARGGRRAGRWARPRAERHGRRETAGGDGLGERALGRRRADRSPIHWGSVGFLGWPARCPIRAPRSRELRSGQSPQRQWTAAGDHHPLRRRAAAEGGDESRRPRTEQVKRVGCRRGGRGRAGDTLVEQVQRLVDVLQQRVQIPAAQGVAACSTSAVTPCTVPSA